jgi:hypothetical protein
MWSIDHRTRLAVAGACLAVAAAGCARSPAPAGAVPRPAGAEADPYGAWIHVERGRGTAPARAGLQVERDGRGPAVAGELLAVDRDTVFVLTQDGAVRGVPLDSVREATIAWYQGHADHLAIWTLLGTVSTISNGWLLILTAPTWLIAGSAASAAESRAPLVRVPARTSWTAARMYARYPAGLPPDLPRRLAPRPPDRPRS